MKPQSSAFLEKSRQALDRAETMLRVDLKEDAGRTAYLAGMHAAQALIFETHDRVFKTHSAVHGEFGRLVKDETGFDVELRAFLGRTYSLKAVADYEIGSGAGISRSQAAEAIATAHRFVAAIESLLQDHIDPEIER